MKERCLVIYCIVDVVGGKTKRTTSESPEKFILASGSVCSDAFCDAARAESNGFRGLQHLYWLIQLLAIMEASKKE
jgi:hypothetical protein